MLIKIVDWRVHSLQLIKVRALKGSYPCFKDSEILSKLQKFALYKVYNDKWNKIIPWGSGLENVPQYLLLVAISDNIGMAFRIGTVTPQVGMGTDIAENYSSVSAENLWLMAKFFAAWIKQWYYLNIFTLSAQIVKRNPKTCKKIKNKQAQEKISPTPTHLLHLSSS